jgi:hypothetical protein
MNSTKNYHSPHSPSALKNWDEQHGGCAHYASADGPEHPLTQQGTAIHEWCENEVNYRWGGGFGSRDIDMDMVQQVNEDPELRSYGEWCMKFLEANVLPEGHNSGIHLERRFSTPFPTCNGRADLLVVEESQGSRAILVDWKTGFRYQGDAEGNLQGLAYAAGVFGEWPVDTVRVYFVYPRLQEVTYVDLTRDDLSWILPRIGTIIGRRQQAGKTPESVPYKQGSSCEFCALRGSCPAWVESTSEAMATDTPALTLEKPSTWDPKELLTQPIEMGKALDVMDELEAYHKELKSFAHLAVAEKDLDIPGRKLIVMTGKLGVKDPVKALASIPAESIPDVVTISAPKIAKLIAARDGVSEAGAREMMIKEGAFAVGANFTQMRKAKRQLT